MSREWTKEPWYAEGPLTDEEACRAGGTPPNIVVASEEPGFPVHIAEFENEADRDRAVDCTNACAPLSDPTTSIPALLRVAEAARKLLLRLEVVHSDPDYQAVWALSQLHGGQYAGPTYTEEKAALDTALSTLPASDERGFT